VTDPTSEEATDYVEEFAQHRALVVTPSAHANREGAPGDLGEGELLGSRDSHGHQGTGNASSLPDPDHAVTEANWQLLAAKLAHVSSSSESVGLSSKDLFKLFGGDKLSSCEIPSIVLDGAPHLRDLNTKLGRDPHLEDTWRLRALYTSTKDSIEPIINLMQIQPLDQPLPWSIWKLIIQDQYVNFEKLFAATDPGYNHHDDAKDFGNGYVLVKKDLATAKKPLCGEADWSRVFNAWRDGTLILYPHHREELQGYAKVVRDIFRASPIDPHNTIR